jgi:hypothetical protein
MARASLGIMVCVPQPFVFCCCLVENVKLCPGFISGLLVLFNIARSTPCTCATGLVWSRPPCFLKIKNKIVIDFVNRNHFMGLAKHEERSQEIGMKSCKHEFFEALLNEELRC